MPIVAPGSKVLVTGANGHIATWVIRTLLEQGYTVRGTVRSQAKGAFLLDLFKSYGDKLELVVVEDLTKENAFDESVNGVDAIEHIAAPMTYQFDSMKDVVDPAVEGTLNILRAAKKTPRVKRIVILSSAAAIKLSGTEPLNENDWNEECLQKYEHDKSSLDPFFAYQVEKTLSEKSAWSFYREHEGRLHWDLTSIVSTFVFGPYLGPASTPGEMNGTSQMWYGAVVAPNSSGQPNEALLAVADGWVDVRDLASTLTRSLIVAEASNERIIVNSGKATLQDWLDVANSLSPSPIPSHANGTAKALPVGNPGAGKAVQYHRVFDTSKEKRIFGQRFRSMDECARDMLADFERRGW